MINACINCKFVYSTMFTEDGATYRCLVQPKFKVEGLFELCRNRCDKYQMIDRLKESKNNVKNNSYINKKKK